MDIEKDIKHIRASVNTMEKNFDKQLAKLEAESAVNKVSIENIDKRMDTLQKSFDNHLSTLSKNIERVDEDIEKVDKRLIRVEDKSKTIEESLEKIDKRLWATIGFLITILVALIALVS